jgi:hypothetical protein
MPSLRVPLITDPRIIEGYLTDASNTRGRADGLVRPRSTEEVAEVVQHCQTEAIPLTVTAQRTSTTGGPVPDGGWLLSTEFLATVHAVDDADGRGDFGLLIVTERLLSVRAAATVMIDECVAGNRHKPRSEAATLRVETIPRPQRALEGELRQILCIVAGAQPVGEVAVHLPHVLVVGGGEPGGSTLVLHPPAAPSGRAEATPARAVDHLCSPASFASADRRWESAKLTAVRRESNSPPRPSRWYRTRRTGRRAGTDGYSSRP